MNLKQTLIAAAASSLLGGASFVVASSFRSSSDDLFMANVDALADSEGPQKKTCETRIKEGDRDTFFCGSCSWVQNSEPTLLSFTSYCEIK